MAGAPIHHLRGFSLGERIGDDQSPTRVLDGYDGATPWTVTCLSEQACDEAMDG